MRLQLQLLFLWNLKCHKRYTQTLNKTFPVDQKVRMSFHALKCGQHLNSKPWWRPGGVSFFTLNWSELSDWNHILVRKMFTELLNQGKKGWTAPEWMCKSYIASLIIPILSCSRVGQGLHCCFLEIMWFWMRPSALIWLVCSWVWSGWDEDQHLGFLSSRKPMNCLLQVGNESLPKVKEFKYVGVLFSCEGTVEREMRLETAGVVLQSLYRTVVMNRELGQKAKLLIYRSVFNPTL